MPITRQLTKGAIRPRSSLIEGLVAYWTMDEPGTLARVDRVSGFQLTTPGTIAQSQGKIGQATNFSGLSNSYLEMASQPLLATGEIDFTVACWVQMDALNQNSRVICAKTHVSPSTSREWTLGGGPATNIFQFDVWNTAGGVNSRAWTGTYTTGVWYLVVAWQAVGENKIYLQVDNGTPVSSTRTITVSATSADFSVGAFGDNSAQCDCQVDSLAFWRRQLTERERAWLWNGGQGRELPFI